MKLKIAKWSYAVAFKSIKPNKEGQELIGSIDESEEEILISPGMNPRQNLRTLWHEIIHGILYVRAAASMQHSEQMICLLEHSIIELFQDNPNLMHRIIPEQLYICGIPYKVVRDDVSESAIDMTKCVLTIPSDATQLVRSWQLVVNLALVIYVSIARLDEAIINQQVKPISHQLYQLLEDNPWLIDVTLAGEFLASIPTPVSTTPTDPAPVRIDGQNGVLLDERANPVGILRLTLPPTKPA